MPQHSDEKDTRTHVLIAFGVLLLGSLWIGGATFSMMCLGSAITLLFGLLIVRAAFVTQSEGWISGAIFGGLILFIGGAASVLSIVYLAHIRM